MQEKKVYPTGCHSISNEAYHSSAGISRSGIVEFKKSAKHFWYKYLNENYVSPPSSPEMEFGTAFHAYVLEPEKFDLEYIVKQDKREKLPEVPLLKDVGREEYDKAKLAYETERLRRKHEDNAFYNAAFGKKQIAQSDLDTIKLMANAIAENPQTDGLITGAQYEQSLYWRDEETGLLCKCRPDILHPHFVVDLKTARDASPRAFQREFYERGYHIQLAFIHMGIKAIYGKHITDFIDLAVEKEAPYCTAIYPIDQTALEYGIGEVRHYLTAIKECYETNQWRSYQSQTITLPSWVITGEQL